ncbi:alanine racemase [Paenibacillus terreus]|uniref:Alanine racemase n=2 Tax=Paenibacillus terreus TaxID=1387834 RepID=A0ABV5B6B5_9BACL
MNGMNVSTPAVIVDLDITERNIQRMAEVVRSAGIRHRPHIKSHKSVYFARKQLEAGCTGITCAKLGEAEVMAEAGFDDILIAFPIIGEDKQERLFRLARQIKVTCVADSMEGAVSVSRVGERLGSRIPLCIEVDGGIGRCGRQPGQDTLEFAKQIHSLPGIEVVGVLSYAGQIYGESSKESIRAMAKSEALLLKQSADMIREAGIDLTVVSGGSSLSSKFAQDLDGVTEVRAGNYLFHDVGQLSMGMVTVDDCALRVVTTVVSVPAPGRAIIDAGSKTLTTDMMPFSKGYGYIIEQPEIEIFKLNEEHGFLRYDPSLSLQIGQQLTIIPNHACVIPNLCDEVLGVRAGKVVERIKIDARGKSS